MNNSVQGGGIIGLLFGLFIGGFIGYASRDFFGDWISSALIGAILVGFLGYFFGDRFWLWLGRNFRYFRSNTADTGQPPRSAERRMRGVVGERHYFGR